MIATTHEVMSPYREKLLALLKDRAFKRGNFTLASGKTSDFYLDCKMVQVSPGGAYLIGNLLYDMTADLDIDAIGGLAIGAVPMVASVMVVYGERGGGIEGFWVREEAKEHGTKKRVEGRLPQNARVVIVDDVVTAGGSVLKAIAAAEEAGATVVKIISLVDREEGGGDLLRQRGYNYTPIFTRSDFIRE